MNQDDLKADVIYRMIRMIRGMARKNQLSWYEYFMEARAIDELLPPDDIDFRTAHMWGRS